MSGAAVHKDVNGLVSSYNTCLSEVLNKHAPLCKRVLTLRPNSPWFSEQLQSDRVIALLLKNKPIDTTP